MTTAEQYRRDMDAVLKFYRNESEPPANGLFRVKPGTMLTNLAQGLGDTLMLTDLVRASEGRENVYSTSPHFRELIPHMPLYQPRESDIFLANAPVIAHCTPTGNGHFIQRIRRAYGYPVEYSPKPYVAFRHLIDRTRKPSAILHFEPGPHVGRQKANVHERARTLYPESKKELEAFVKEQSACHQFFQIGRRNLRIKGAKFLQTPTLYSLLQILEPATWFIGIQSGPMHLATALGLPCIVVVNFPHAQRIMMPVCRHMRHDTEYMWLQPQHTYLHQDNEGPTVKRFNCLNLHKAWNNELYPYGQNEHLHLIDEPLTS